MTKKRKIILMLAGVFIVLPIISLVSTLFFLETDLAQHYLQKKINALIPGKITWKHICFSVIRGRFEITEAKLQSPDNHDIASVDRLYLDISLKALLSGKVNLYRLTLDHPQVRLAFHDGKMNIVQAFPRPKHREREIRTEHALIPFYLAVEELEIINGEVSYDAKNFHTELGNIRLKGKGNSSEQLAEISLNIGSGKLKIPQLSAELHALSAKGGFNHGRFDAPEIALLLDADYGEKFANNRIELKTRLEDRRITLDPLVLKTEGGDLNIIGDIDFTDAFPEGFFSSHRNIELLAYHLQLVGQRISLEKWFENKAKGNLSTIICLDGKGISLNTLSSSIQAEIFAHDVNAKALNLPAATVKAETEVKENTLILKMLETSIGESSLHAKGRYEFSTHDVNAALEINAPDIEKSLSLFGIKDVHGKLLADIEVSGNIRKPDFNIDFHGNDLKFKEIMADIADIRASLDNTGNLNVSQLQLRHQDSEIRGIGNIALYDSDLLSDFSLELTRVNAEQIVPKPYLRGSIDGKLEVKGNLKQPSIKADLKGKNLESVNIRIGDVRLKADLDDTGTIAVSALSIENENSEIRAEGSFQLFDHGFKLHSEVPITADLSLSNAELKDFWDKEYFHGTVDGKVRVRGTAKSLDAALLLNGRNIAVGKNQIGNVEADLKFAKGELRADTLKISNRQSSLAVSGTAQLLEPDRFKPLQSPMLDLKLSSDKLLIENFIKGMKGFVTASAHIRGTPEAMSGDIRADAKNVDTGVQKIPHISLDSRLDGDKLMLDSLQIAFAPEEAISGTGWLSFQKTFDLTLKSDGISLSRIDAIKNNDSVDGRLWLSISGKGSFDNPDVSGTIGLKNLKLNDKPAENMLFDVEIKDHLAKVSGKLNFDLDGRFDLNSKNFSASLRFDHTDLAPYFVIAGQDALNGHVSGIIRASGNAENPAGIRAEANLSDIELFHQDRELVRAKNLTAIFADKILTLPQSRLQIMKSGYVSVSGKADSDGNADITIDLEQIGFDIPETEQRLHDLNGRIRIANHRIDFEDIKGGWDSGSFEIAGNIGLDRFKPKHADIEIRGDALPVKVPDTADTLLNTRLKLTGVPEKSLLQGEIVMIEGRYYRNMNLSLLNMVQSVKERKREVEVVRKNVELNYPFAKQMALDISLKRRNAFLVDNDIAKLEVLPDLKIQGTLNKPLVSGRAEIPTGSIKYQKKTFELKRGYIDFVNPYEIEPELNIEAKAEIRKWTVVLTITGTPKNLNFKLSSTPFEEHGDILSLILIGKTTKELIEREGGTSQAPGQLLAQIVAETFGDDFKNATGLDIFQVDFEEKDERKVKNNNGSSAVKVTVGKELSKRMVVKYAVESKDGETIQKAIAEYKFLENLLMIAFQDSKGGFGGELQFRLEFR